VLLTCVDGREDLVDTRDSGPSVTVVVRCSPLGCGPDVAQPFESHLPALTAAPDAAAALLPFFDEPADGLVDILAGLFDLLHVEPAPSDAIIRDAEKGDSPHRKR
jgi:hypothetical protein